MWQEIIIHVAQHVAALVPVQGLSSLLTTILEPGRGQLNAEPHIRPISCHVASLSWQEPEEELTNFS